MCTSAARMMRRIDREAPSFNSGISIFLRPLVYVAILALQVGVFPCRVVADLLRVPDEYPSISAALTVAAVGDTVGVREGTYVDSFNPRPAVAVLGGFNLTFSQRDPVLHPTTLSANGRVVTCMGGGVGPTTVIDGFIMTGGIGIPGGLVYLDGCSPTVSHCRFLNATGASGGSVYLRSSSSLLFENEFVGGSSNEIAGGLAVLSSNGVVVRNCRFEDNTSTASGGAIFTDFSPAVRIAGCSFINNRSGVGGAALLIQTSSASIDSCFFAHNSCPGPGTVGIFSDSPSQVSTMDHCTLVSNTAGSGAGVYVNDRGRITVTHTIVASNNNDGLEVQAGGLIPNSCNDVWNNIPIDYVGVVAGANSFSLDPLFCDPGADDYRLQGESPCNSPVCGLIGGITETCPGDFIRVPDDYPRILYAMNAAVANDTVAVAEGHYPEHVTLKRNVRLLGGWRSDFSARDPMLYPSVIDAGGLLSAVVAQNGESPLTVLDGFVITGGNNPNAIGGGVYCFHSSPTIRNNVIIDNRSAQGAGIGCSANSAPVIIGNLLVNNVALSSPGGAIYVEEPARIESNTLDGNEGPQASGIAMRFGAQPVITRNIVVNGVVGVGVYGDKGSVPVTSCNDVWNNQGGEYYGVLPGPDSFSLDPLFCPGDDRLLDINSPCAPPHSPAACGLIGARPADCTTTTSTGPIAPSLRPSWLGPAAPNPFRAGAALIAFGLARESSVRLVIFDAAGRQVRALVDGVRPAGDQAVVWDGRSDPGAMVPSGVYFYELSVDHQRIGRQKQVIVR